MSPLWGSGGGVNLNLTLEQHRLNDKRTSSSPGVLAAQKGCEYM
jgi:hypothetical protein